MPETDTRYINRETGSEALFGIRIKLVQVAIIVSWLMFIGLVIISIIRPESFNAPIWGLLYISTALLTIVSLIPWNKILIKPYGSTIAFIITVLLVILVSIINYLFHSNRVFPFMLIVIFSAIFYDKKKFMTLSGLTIAGLSLSMMSVETYDALAIETIGMMIFALLSYWLADSYKRETVSSYMKSDELAARVEQLNQINKASLILISQIHSEEFIHSLIKVASDLLHIKNVSYISFEKNENYCYYSNSKKAIGKDLKGSKLYEVILEGSNTILNAELLPDQLCYDKGDFFISPVRYNDQIYGALVLDGFVPSNDFLLNIVSNHAAVGIFKRKMLADIENSNIELKEKDRIKQDLLKKLMTVQEEERKRIARELHDEIGQTLSSLLITIELAYKNISDDKVKDTLEILINDLQGTIYEIDRIIWSLRPTILDDLGLIPAVRSLSRRFTERLGLEVDFDFADNIEMTNNVETTLYRFAQEGLNNIVKHSQATNATIRLTVSDSKIQMVISDNGTGFDSNILSLNVKEDGVYSMGIQGIRERLSMYGGELSIITSTDGTTIKAELPIETEAPEEEQTEAVYGQN